ncbi:MAG TPA: Asp-tRNA(Asn)/Glu-tRNA(Gln) amidotransferase subunit GatB [Candidatus Margulisiibacteriota bacterium]|nr:Asp-tRNA(Asn)/Glu-tRNA(Gln) amidotransferase subunit GatB [Candidatus Margulisiibacteriota bacterium]
MEYETVIGLEVHLQLNTRTKAFCGCSTEFGNEPNTQVCPVCLGFPGSLPVYNKQALDYAIKVALALNCRVQEFTKFDRKHYYYPDLPKNYQISQYDLPLARKGFLDIYLEGNNKRIGITRVHMEEDAGKLIHRQETSLVDLNRAGVPLLEIVSEPDINSPQEAYEYLTSLKSILEYLDVSDCDMEKGSLRCDANISIREKGVVTLGTKTELKNMNSFKAVKDALAFEVERQRKELAAGNKISQETRLWDPKEQKTITMRTKEEAKDYRYFPEPDLPPFIIKDERVNEILRGIPELPKTKTLRFMKEYGLSEYDAKILVATKNNADYSEERLRQGKNKKSVANWLIGPLSGIASSNNIEISEIKISTGDFLELIELVESKQLISNLRGKEVLAEMFATGKPPALIIQEKNLAQISDEGVLEKEIEEVIEENAKSVEDFKAGKANALMFLVGQVMKKSKGKANPKVVQEMLKGRLSHA